jgi:hypothetical protein
MQSAKDLKGKIENVLDNKVGPAARDAVTTVTQRSVEETRPEQQPDTLGSTLNPLFWHKLTRRSTYISLVFALIQRVPTGDPLTGVAAAVVRVNFAQPRSTNKLEEKRETSSLRKLSKPREREGESIFCSFS